MRILYVEDEIRLAEAVVYLLKKSDIAVDHTTSGAEGLDWAQHGSYDCIVLDIMLPQVSGLEILRALREQGNTTPVIMLSALSQVDDKVKALEAGADDYLAKPFKTAELIARIKAICRRPPLQTEHALSFGDLCYDPDNRTISVTGLHPSDAPAGPATSVPDAPAGPATSSPATPITLTTKEAELLELFLRHPDQTQSKPRLLTYAWGNESAAPENYVEVYISYLRKKLRLAGSSVQIRAVRGLGYKLIWEPNATTN